MNEVEDRVLALLADVCGTNKVKKDLDLDLIKSGYLDSMGIVSLLTEIEDEFEIEIPIDVFSPEDLNTANKIIAFVVKNS